MQPIMLYLLFIHLALSEDIWYHPMNTASASWSGSVSYSVLTGNAVCPAGNNYCYHLTDPGYVDYTAPSNNPAFQRIDLTYAMGASGMDITEACSILYSVDNDGVWTTIQQLSSDGEITRTNSLSNPSADNVAALTIRLEFTGHKNHECYFNEFRLSGTRITTNPTQAPTNDPTSPSADPTGSPSSAPSSAPSRAPSSAPSRAPSESTSSPSNVPTTVSSAPSSAPSESTLSPSGSTLSPTSAPTEPTYLPTLSPTYYGYWTDWIQGFQDECNRNGQISPSSTSDFVTRVCTMYDPGPGSLFNVAFTWNDGKGSGWVGAGGLGRIVSSCWTAPSCITRVTTGRAYCGMDCQYGTFIFGTQWSDKGGTSSDLWGSAGSTTTHLDAVDETTDCLAGIEMRWKGFGQYQHVCNMRAYYRSIYALPNATFPSSMPTLVPIQPTNAPSGLPTTATAAPAQSTQAPTANPTVPTIPPSGATSQPSTSPSEYTTANPVVATAPPAGATSQPSTSPSEYTTANPVVATAPPTPDPTPQTGLNEREYSDYDIHVSVNENDSNENDSNDNEDKDEKSGFIFPIAGGAGLIALILLIYFGVSHRSKRRSQKDLEMMKKDPPVAIPYKDPPVAIPYKDPPVAIPYKDGKYRRKYKGTTKGNTMGNTKGNTEGNTRGNTEGNTTGGTAADV